MQNFAPWAWTELLAFDNTQPDGGAAEYLASLSFTPEAICLMTSSPDFILGHTGCAEERVLPPDVCARNGQAGNERRQRQEWTNWQLRNLISELKKAGCEVYCSCFTTYQENRFHEEKFVTAHPEVRLTWAGLWRGQELNVLAQLNDGTLFEDYFIPKVVEVCRDYGFNGWHGPDGYGPWSGGNITGTDFSDATVPQFTAGRGWDLPECFRPIPRIATMNEVLAARKANVPVSPAATEEIMFRKDGFLQSDSQAGLAQLAARRDWICQNHFAEWREFIAARWEQFWSKALKALHAEGFKAVINSAWTKGCFDAYHEFGLDYRRIARAGVDAMVVETVALGMSMTRPETPFHDAYAAALADIHTALPDLKLVFLHGIKDIDEFWDNLRQAPAGYERELYKLTHLYSLRPDGTLSRAADRLLACLADGIAPHEWTFIRERWDAAFDHPAPQEAGLLPVLLPDAFTDAAASDYWGDSFPPALDQVNALMIAGLPLQVFTTRENAPAGKPVLLPSAHLLPRADLDALLQRHPGSVLCGRAEALDGIPGERLTDGQTTLVLTGRPDATHQCADAPAERRAPGFAVLGFYFIRHRAIAAPAFWQEAAKLLLGAFGDGKPALVSANFPCSLLYQRIDEKTWEVAVEARAPWGRAKAVVKLPAPIRGCRIRSSFPVRPCALEGDCLTLPIPPRGIAVAQVTI